MSTAREVIKEIRYLTASMIEVGLCLDQNYPSEKMHSGESGPVTDLFITGADEISTALRERPYPEIYAALKHHRAYNLKLVDGALIQFRYRFQGDRLLKHSLAFFPSPDLLEYQNDPELYETESLYADIVQKDIVTVPIRFDYDENAFVENVHPKSHLTIGQYKNCRLAVASALTPYRFLELVLRAFYNTAFEEYCRSWRGSATDFPCSVTVNEMARLHLSYR